MITDLISIAKSLLDLVEAIMRDDPEIETKETEASIAALKTRLDKYAAARKALGR